MQFQWAGHCLCRAREIFWIAAGKLPQHEIYVNKICHV
jgi:hypothetical protein